MCFVGNKKGALKEIGTFMMTTCFIANYQSVQVSQVHTLVTPLFKMLNKVITTLNYVTIDI